MKYIIYTYHIQIAGNQKIKKIILEEVKVKKKKKNLTYRESKPRIIPNFFSERREWGEIFKELRGKNHQAKIKEK